MERWWRRALVSPDGVATIRMVSVSVSVNLPLHHKVQKFSSGTSWPGWSRKKGCKTVVVVMVNLSQQCMLHYTRNLCSSSMSFAVELCTYRSLSQVMCDKLLLLYAYENLREGIIVLMSLWLLTLFSHARFTSNFHIYDRFLIRSCVCVIKFL